MALVIKCGVRYILLKYDFNYPCKKKKEKKRKQKKAVAQQTPRKAEATADKSDAAAAKEPETEQKRKAEVVIKESDNKNDEEIPELVRIQTAGINGQEVILFYQNLSFVQLKYNILTGCEEL